MSRNFVAFARGGEAELWKHKKRATILKKFHSMEPHLFAEKERGRSCIFNGTYYQKLPWIEGQNFREFCASSGVSEEEKIFLFAKAVEALAEQCRERRREMHGDIRPENLLLTPTRKPIWIDWPILQPGFVCITERYAAPEKLQLFRDTVASEIYSLGRMLQEFFPDEDILAKALHRFPWRRFSSYAELARALYALHARRSIDAHADTPSGPEKYE